MLLRIVLVFVYTENDGYILALGRRRDNDFFSPALKMGRCFSSIGKKTGRFYYQIHAVVFPRNLSRVAFSDYFCLPAVNNYSVVFCLNLSGIDAVVAVIL